MDESQQQEAKEIIDDFVADGPYLDIKNHLKECMFCMCPASQMHEPSNHSAGCIYRRGVVLIAQLKEKEEINVGF